MNWLMARLREKSTWFGIAAIAKGIGDCVAGNLNAGLSEIVAGLALVMTREFKQPPPGPPVG